MDLKRRKILLAEDEPHMMRLLTYNLKKLGFDLITANDGLEAQNLLLEIKPELIISDVMMPRMDGFQLCQWAKSNPNLKNIPFIILSSKGQIIDKEMGIAYGADYYMTKPFDMRKLIGVVEEIFNLRKQ